VSRYEIGEFSATTGKLLRTLYPVSGQLPRVEETLEWTNASGSVLVVAAPPGPGKPAVFGILSRAGLRHIPGAPAHDEDIATLAF
jgi:hypothetical protein